MPSPVSLWGHVITQSIAIVGFVIVPAVVTLVAPLTDLELRRAEGGATVTVTRYVLMVVPWQTVTVQNVAALRAETTPAHRYADTAENRRKGRAGAVSHATGQLVVVGRGAEVIVQAAPELAKSISTRFEELVASRSSEPVRMTVYASWSLSYLLGGALSVLTALYLGGACLALLAWLTRAIRGKAAHG